MGLDVSGHPRDVTLPPSAVVTPERRRQQYPPDTMALAPGSALGPCEIVAPLGDGGMGAVYRARDRRLHRDVAVKVLRPPLDAPARARFEREARAIAALNHLNWPALVATATGQSGRLAPYLGVRWYYQGITMPTVTVKLDKERAARLARWARQQKVPKSEVIRALIDRAGPVATGDDLIAWVKTAQGKGLGLRQRKA
jgi:hypothetical protein